MKKINWGIISTGIIANNFAVSLKDELGSNLYAVASRSEEKAKAFAEKYSIEKYYTPYESLIEDPGVDIIYIGVPNQAHYPLIKQCLEAGKPVLCEKPFTLNAAEAKECIELAKEKGLFLMEAMWTRFFPIIQEINRKIKDGILSDIRFIQADFMAYRPYDPTHRLFNMELGGGALLDLGIYPLSVSNYFLGQPTDVKGQCIYCDTGADFIDAILLTYPNDINAMLSCGFKARKPRECWIVGAKGYIKIHEAFYKPHRYSIVLEGEKTQEFHHPIKSNGYIYMIESVNNCLRKGLTENPVILLSETLAQMEIMDGLRREWGVVYPEEH